ncbi:LuxR C-terminal-related transcriptional regulator [Piscinibacter koreensis]|uniref:Transcriptional regulator n=1 Tax=Piscinibacter koreensis TaxID=2742824 RepID=A0A7Y6NLU2_9BURK|nr:LuxR C-terminal-related transcriptional regulator [Schlegelella koreensis]NUZ05517.1 transcriptional regulator [Schlegelella koreensis]
MTPSFALTKIQPPRPRAGLVARVTLEERLVDAALSKRLVLVAAPAGFGKTAALTRLIARLGGAASVAWVAVDLDDDALALLACLCAALEPFDPPWRIDPEALVAMAGGSRGDRRAALGELVNTLAACDVRRGLIVVDDAHRIRDAAVFDFVDQLLERLPAQWGLIVATRSEPPLSLARLRAHDELAEFREPDLRFTLDEVGALLAPAAAADGADSLDATSRRLLHRTHGWAVGLRLAVNSLRTGHATRAAIADGATDRHVFDYLLAEVLDEMPRELRCFLLRCSVLSELTAGRCAAVSADARAAEWLEEIERRGLFVSVLAGAEPTLRLHDLFRDFLQDRLRREMADELPLLYRRAAAGEPDTLRRIGFLVRAGDWSEAEAVLARAGAEIIITVGPAPVLRLLEQFPPDVRERSGALAHMRCLCAWSRWDWPRMGESARQAQAAFESAGDTLAAYRSGIYVAVATAGAGRGRDALTLLDAIPIDRLETRDAALAGIVRVYCAFDIGRFDEVGPLYARVLDTVEPSDSVILWYQCVPRALQCGIHGMREPLARFATGALRATPDTPTPLRAMAYVAEGWGEFLAGRFAAAARVLQRAEADARWLGPPANVRVYVYGALSMLHALNGDRAASRHAVDELMKLFDDPDVGYRRGSVFHAYYQMHAVRVADIGGDVDAVLALAAALPARSELAKAPAMLQAFRDGIEGRVAWHRGELEHAADAFARALEPPLALGVFGQSNEIRLRLARAWLRLGRLDEAAAMITAALDSAERAGEPGGALAIGAAGLLELADAAWGERLEPTATAQLRAWAACFASEADGERALRPAALEAAPSAAPTASATPLSARELDVLRHIAAGDSNKLIARALDLSPHTVKRHVANILDKLALQSRGQAAAWYRAHVAG